ncbi:hypothetical protein AAEJ74_18995 [Limnospira fusiformis PMC 851.14]|uniref:Uncharacterized protein n=3 Tax=Limnospira TaxID=2596745 RepID=A0ABU9EP08_LIMFS
MGVLFLTQCAAMDEERSQAYLSLIQELLNCPGEALQILNSHLELVDEGFVQVCELVAANCRGCDGCGIFRCVLSQSPLLKTARRHEHQLKVAIRNPVVWLIEVLQEQ